MTADELRALQAPLKERYRERPESAIVTMAAEGELGPDLTVRLRTGKPGAPIALHPAAGGDGRAACSGEMLLEALVGCAGVTLSAVATAMGITIRRGVIRGEGDLDFRGTLGVCKDVPVGLQRLRLRFELDTDAPEAQIEKLLQLTERYCVVYQTLRQPPPAQISWQRR